MIEIIAGRMGSGKTLLSGIEADEHRRQYPDAKMVGNLPLSIEGWEYTEDPFAEMDETLGSSFENSFWLIDQVHLFLDSRMSAKSDADKKIAAVTRASENGARIVVVDFHPERIDSRLVALSSFTSWTQFNHNSDTLTVNRPIVYKNASQYFPLLDIPER